MSLRRHMSSRARLRLALLAVGALLLQLVLPAVHACTLEVPRAHATMTALHDDAPALPSEGDGVAMCIQHCTRHATVTPDAVTPRVPPAMLPELPPITAQASSRLAVEMPVFHAAPHPSPPLTQLYCTLQI